MKRFFRRLLLGYDIDKYYFSQSGEDAILEKIFYKKLRAKNPGFYVDVGAYHPYKDSNTYLFYLNGWRGINIDARPGSMKPFNACRPRDINLENGVGISEGHHIYYLIDNNSTMNSFSKQNLIELGMDHLIKKEISLKVSPLRSILGQYARHFKKIDFLNIDAEGMDYEIILSNDWQKYRPEVIAVEMKCVDLEIMNNNTAKYLINLDYIAIAKTVILKNLATVIFVQNDFEY